MASSSRVTPDAAQVEGRRADLLDDVLQIAYAAPESRCCTSVDRAGRILDLSHLRTRS